MLKACWSTFSRLLFCLLRCLTKLPFLPTRQLSEENANLQEYVEKESNEKKRLSRTNEELLWRLQTGELSPRMSPSGSPIHRAASGPTSPSRVQPFPRWVHAVQTPRAWDTSSLSFSLALSLYSAFHLFGVSRHPLNEMTLPHHSLSVSLFLTHARDSYPDKRLLLNYSRFFCLRHIVPFSSFYLFHPSKVSYNSTFWTILA